MRIGIDLGGTKISGILLNAAGTECARAKTPTPQGDYRATVEAIRDLANQIAPDEPHIPLGVGMPGAVSPKTGLVKNANSTCLIGNPFQHDLETATGRATRLANDADCFTLSEASDGAGSQHQTVFGVILGTGVGGGFCVSGTLLSGPNAIAGEWGHNPLPWMHPKDDPAHQCYCGKSGCIETFLSGPGLAAHHKALFGEDATTREIATESTAAFKKSMALYTDRLARALSHVINILDPHAIVLGGGMSEIPSLYKSVPNLWGRYVFSDHVETKLLQNQHGADSGVRGAAWLWKPEEALAEADK